MPQTGVSESSKNIDPKEELGGSAPIGGVKSLEFEELEYTTFLAEWALDGIDLVFHFKLPTSPEDLRKIKYDGDYWQGLFPGVLSEVAQEVFKATYPQLKAAFTPEMDSWWMRAYGFGKSFGAEELVRKFLDTLDIRLESRLS